MITTASTRSHGLDPTRTFGKETSISGIGELRQILEGVSDASLYTYRPQIKYTFVRPVVVNSLEEKDNKLTIMLGIRKASEPTPLIFSTDRLPTLRLTNDRSEVLIQVPGEETNLLVSNAGLIASKFGWK